MKEDHFLKRGSGNFTIALIGMLLAACAIVISLHHEVPEHPSCRGMLGAGFPVLWLCDDWGGGSPTSSWGRITPIDVINGGIRPQGLLVDFLFYTALFCGAMVLMRAIHGRMTAIRRGR